MTIPIYFLVGDMICLKKKAPRRENKERQLEAILTENTTKIDDPPSPISRHVKWKLALTKRYGQMTSEATQEISDKIVSGFFNF